MNTRIALSGATLYTEAGMLSGGNLVMCRGKIESIDASLSDVSSVLTLSPRWHVIPGMIDLHLHGCFGAGVMDGKSESIKKISRALLAFGVTGFLASTMTFPLKQMEVTLLAINDFLPENDRSGAALLGIHLEGPFISTASDRACGAQRAEAVMAPDMAVFKRWQQHANHLIKIVTIAPEVDSEGRFTRYLKSQNIIASIGHTEASYEQTKKAIDSGCSQATHLFNAMTALHHRHPGCVTAILNDPRVLAEIIVDGIHLHPGIVELILKAKGLEHIVLVSDSLAVTGLSEGIYPVDGQEVTLKNHEARLPNGSLAGSVLTLDQALRNFIAFTGCSLNEALKTVTENPAKQLGLFDRIGSLRVGKDADIVVLDETLKPVMTFRQGELVRHSDH